MGLPFVKLGTSLEGLMVRAVDHWHRFLKSSPDDFTWVCVERAEILARTLEILAPDLPEEDLGRLVRRMPSLMLLFQRAGLDRTVPVDAIFAFLTVLNHAGMVTLLRQTSDRHRLAEQFDLDQQAWHPLIFLLGGVPDLDAGMATQAAGAIRFF